MIKTAGKMLLIIINGERDKRSFKFFSSHRIVKSFPSPGSSIHMFVRSQS